jgi:hypothetical protein
MRSLMSCAVSRILRSLRPVGCGLAVLALLALSGGASRAQVVSFTTTQLTDDSLYDWEPQISGARVTWMSQRGASALDREIMFWDGTTTQLTSNSVVDSEPVISGSNVAWTGNDGDSEIFLWNGTSTSQISVNTVTDGRPRIDGSKVVWEWDSGLNKVIGFFNGTSTATLSAVQFNNEPSISGARLVWFGSTVPTRDMYTSDNGGPVNPVPDVDPGALTAEDLDASGTNVVWEGFVGNSVDDREIFYNDGSATTQITTNSYPDFSPKIGGDEVTWWGGVFKDFQVRHYDHSTGTTTTLSTGELNQNPQISHGNVVWQGKPTLADDFEIYFWDGTTVHQLTDNAYDDITPQISGSNVVWVGVVGGTGFTNEIFVAVGAGPPAVPALGGHGLLAVAILVSGVGLWRARA